MFWRRVWAMVDGVDLVMSQALNGRWRDAWTTIRILALLVRMPAHRRARFLVRLERVGSRALGGR